MEQRGSLAMVCACPLLWKTRFLDGTLCSYWLIVTANVPWGVGPVCPILTCTDLGQRQSSDMGQSKMRLVIALHISPEASNSQEPRKSSVFGWLQKHACIRSRVVFSIDLKIAI